MGRMGMPAQVQGQTSSPAGLAVHALHGVNVTPLLYWQTDQHYTVSHRGRRRSHPSLEFLALLDCLFEMERRKIVTYHQDLARTGPCQELWLWRFTFHTI